MLPLPKVPVKVSKVVKSGGPPSSNPLATLINSSTKLKLPASPHPDAIPSRPLPTPVADAPKKAVAFAKPELPLKPSKSKEKPLKDVPKSAHVPKAQSGGMPLNDLRASRNALKKLKMNKRAPIFLQPVDPIRDHAPK
jgi:transcription initiation factor TFIID subunit 2